MENNFEVKYWDFEDETRQRNDNNKHVSIWNDLIIKKAGITLPLSMVWFFPAFGTGVFVFLPEIMIMEGFEMKSIYYISSYLLFLPMFGVLVSSIFIDHFGRKQIIWMWSLMGGLSLCSFYFLPRHSNKIMAYYIILGVYSIFMRVLKSTTSLYTPELYSTSTRTTALGFMNGIDRSASILQPIVFTSLIYTSTRLSMVGFGICFLLGFVFSLCLTKETARKPLKDSFLSSGAELYFDSNAIDYSSYTEF